MGTGVRCTNAEVEGKPTNHSCSSSFPFILAVYISKVIALAHQLIKASLRPLFQQVCFLSHGLARLHLLESAAQMKR